MAGPSDYEVIYRAIADFSQLRKEADAADRRLEKLERRANKVEASARDQQKKSTAQVEKLADAYDEADESLFSFVEDIAKSEDSLKRQRRSILDTVNALGALGDVDTGLPALSADSDRAADTLDDLSGSSKKAQRSIRDLGNESSASQGRFAGLVALIRRVQDTLRRDDGFIRFSANLRASADAGDDAGNSFDRLLSRLPRMSSALSRGRKDWEGFGLKVRFAMAEMDRGGGSMDNFGRVITRTAGRLANLGSVIAGLSKIAGIASLIGLAANALNGLAAAATAAVSSLGPLLGIVGALPGALAVLALPIATLVGGFSGLGDAIGAFVEETKGAEQASAQAAAAARDEAEAQEERERTLSRAREQAARRIVIAERSLAQAQKGVLEAQEDLNDARAEAAERIEELEERLSRQTLLEGRAEFNVAVAERRLLETISDPGATAIDRRDAELDLAEAQAEQADVVQEGIDVEQELDDRRRRGIDQAEEVIDAQENLAAAVLAVSDAQYEMGQALQNQEDVQREANRATAEAVAEVSKLQEALADLSPEARAFAEYIASLRPLLVQFRQAVQANLLPPVQRAIGIIVDRLLPTLTERFAELAGVIGTLFVDLAEEITDPQSMSDWGALFDIVRDAMIPLGDTVRTLIDGLLQLAVAGEPLLDWLIDVARRWANIWHNFIETGRATGELQASMRETIDAAQRWGSVISNLWVTLRNIFDATRDQSMEMLEWFDNATQGWADFTGSIEGQNAIQGWVEQARPVVAELGRFLRDLGSMFLDVATDSENALIPFLRILRTQVIPNIGEFLKIFAGDFAIKMAELLVAVTDIVLIISQNGGAMQAFVGTLVTIAETIVGIVNAVPGLDTAIGLFATLAGTAGAIGLVMKPIVPMLSAIVGWFIAPGGITASIATATAKVGTFAGSFAALGPAAIVVAGLAAAIAAADLAWGTRQTDESRSLAASITSGSEDGVDALRNLAEEAERSWDIIGSASNMGDLFYFDNEAERARENIRSIYDEMLRLQESGELTDIIATPEGALEFNAFVGDMTDRIADLQEVANNDGWRSGFAGGLLVDDESRNARNEIEELRGVMDDLAPATDEALESLNEFNAQLRADDVITDFSDDVADIAAEFGFSESALRSLVDNGLMPATVRTGDLEQAQSDLRTAAEEARNAIDGQRTALRALTDPVFAVANAESSLADAQQRVNDLRASGTATADEIAAADRRVVEAAFALDDALYGLQDAYLAGELSADGYRAAVERQVDLGRITREQADLMIANLGEATSSLGTLQENLATPLVMSEVDGDPMLNSLSEIATTAVQTVDSIFAGLDNPAHASMGAAIAAAEEGGEEVASTHDSWMSKAVKSYQDATDEFVSETREATSTVHTTWQTGSRDILAVFDTFETNSGRTADDTYSYLATVAERGLGNVERQWDQHPGEITVPVNQVIQGPVNLGIVGAWNHIATIIGEDEISPMSVVRLNTGGTVRDPYGRSSTAPNKDSVYAHLTPGEEVINQKAAAENRPLLKYINAGGRVLSDGEGFVTTGLNHGRADASQYPLSAGAGNAPSRGKSALYHEGADHDGPGTRQTGFGGVKPWVAQAGHYIKDRFSVPSVGGVGPRANASDHPSGHALDFMVYQDAAKGDAIAEHMAANAGHYGVKYIIWWQHINQGRGWKPMEDRGSITANHYDHPHVSFHRSRSQTDTSFSPETIGGGVFTGGGGIGFLTEAMDALDAQNETITRLMETSDPGSFARLTATVGETMLAKARDAMMAKASLGMGGAGAKAVEHWAPTVLKALDIMNLDAGYLGTTLRRMNQESGGDPNVVNRWDSNWRKGTPSVGLMQVIGPTYRSHRHPDHDIGPYLYGTSVNPLANILASMDYALDRYGSLPKAYDRAGGYDQGGLIHKGFNLMYSGLNEPEVVSPVPIMREAFRNELDDWVAGLAGGAGLQTGLRSPVASAVASAVRQGAPTSVVAEGGGESIGTKVENLNVYNPRPEPTSQSLPRTIRKLAYT